MMWVIFIILFVCNVRGEVNFYQKDYSEEEKDVLFSCFALKDVWLSVTVDGDKIFSGTLDQGEEEDWAGEEYILIESASFPYLKMLFNQKYQEFQGKEAKNVRNILVTDRDIAFNIDTSFFEEES